MPAPKAILELVQRFLRNRESYEDPQFNEAQTRIQFINPFFTELGWDVENRAGYAEAYKDVVHEDSLKIGAATKAPDYSFRVGGTRRFFVEAKKPSVVIREMVDPAFQLRRYATTRLDSFYTQPRLLRSNGAEPDRANVSSSFVGSDWQFWSRHLADNEWRVGIDGMETYQQHLLNELRIA